MGSFSFLDVRRSRSDQNAQAMWGERNLMCFERSVGGLESRSSRLIHVSLPNRMNRFPQDSIIIGIYIASGRIHLKYNILGRFI